MEAKLQQDELRNKVAAQKRANEGVKQQLTGAHVWARACQWRNVFSHNCRSGARGASKRIHCVKHSA